MQTHQHPVSGVPIFGIRLPPGTAIEQGDRYDSTMGSWEPAGGWAGLVIESGCKTIWVRDPKPLSADARTLLGHLKERFPTCIGTRRGVHYVIPSPSFNWDGRVQIESQQVRHPECIEELVSCGYLILDRHPAMGTTSDYATVGPGHQNNVYTLTEAGHQKGEEILAEG